VLLPAELLRDLLHRAVPAPDVVAEDGGWTVALPGHPVAADGATLDEALADFVSALHDYSGEWEERLHRAPDHRRATALVQHVALADDDTLLAWARGGLTDPTMPRPAA
jgi:predicted RNase H-like HicB family nuclease